MNIKDRDALEFLYKTSLDTRNFEITQLVARNNFFMVFQGVLLAGLAQASDTAPHIVAFMICIAGVLASIMQAFMASGAKFWQERWEAELECVEKRLINALNAEKELEGTRTLDVQLLFSLPPNEAEKLVEKRKDGRDWIFRLVVRRFSVSRIPIYAGYAFACVWTILLLCMVSGPWGNIIPEFIIGFPSAK